MLARAFSSAMNGIDGYVVRIESDSSPGVPSFSIIGMPDRALNEARERVRAAIVNSGFGFPPGRLLVSLAPADLRKTGPGFDVAIALALLATDEQLPAEAVARFLIVGELALDGSIHARPGILAVLLAASEAGFERVIVPAEASAEAALVAGPITYAAATLADAVAVVLGHGENRRIRPHAAPTSAAIEVEGGGPDFADVRGQRAAKRALEIAAAGGHNALLVGPPGCGKTMLARRIPSILPAMPLDEALAVTKIYSIAGALGANPRLVRTRPFRAPHHTISAIALVGGGAHPKPGEISLAQHGVLYLDELGEYSRATLDVMRGPLEERAICIARASGTVSYPADFMLVASMNPCPCGFRGSRTAACRCDDAAVARYAAKLSGPLLDRIDLHVTVARMSFDELTATAPGEPSAAVRKRVHAARDIAEQRYTGRGFAVNARADGRALREHAALDAPSRALLESAMTRGSLSARGFDRVVRVARTIADLDDAANIMRAHVAEALMYRGFDAATAATATASV